MWAPDAISSWVRSAGGTAPGVWLIKNVVSPMQRSIYRGTRGRVSLTGRLPVLLLTSTGHRSDKLRTVPVFYLRSGDSFVICNVRPPGERANPWVRNVGADPKVRLEISGLVLRGRARRATEAELARVWPKLVAIWPAFQTFFSAGGERSVFVIEPVRQEPRDFNSLSGKPTPDSADMR
jgi:deazaflavin-dependent oxidoreductase (nitroreductase family)